ncbi:MAG: flagellar basal body P-ring formation chaperone FlgA [Gammaproteobacteria bacterium]|nr:flagellar basal body P-ring formation chaperone FlgA [Gammaproteobacteria bacterium]
MGSRNKEVNSFRIALMIFASCCSQTIFADTFETPAHLQEITKAFLTQNITGEADDTVVVTVSPSIAQLQLPTCTREIEADFPTNTNKDQATGIELTCNGTAAWHVLVPVSVQINTKVLVAKQTLMPKEPITEDEIEYATYDKNHLYNSYFKNKEEVVGQVAAHLITPGVVLTKKNLQQPILIHRNEAISLTAKIHSISVTMQGIAKSDGSINTTIKVYNPTSKRLVDAIVVGTGKAEIVA